MHYTDYIPTKEAEFGPWAHTLITYAKANADDEGDEGKGPWSDVVSVIIA
jgi:hypothetical protein